MELSTYKWFKSNPLHEGLKNFVTWYKDYYTKK